MHLTHLCFQEINILLDSFHPSHLLCQKAIMNQTYFKLFAYGTFVKFHLIKKAKNSQTDERMMSNLFIG